MSMRDTWNRFDHYAYGAVAVLGTMAAIMLLDWAMTTQAWHLTTPAMSRITGPFMNIIGVLFGLTLAFLANDTWSAHAAARNAVQREADAIRSLDILIDTLPEALRSGLSEAVRHYATAAAGEWRELARCRTSPAAVAASDELMRRFCAVENRAGAGALGVALDQVREIRDSRGLRVGLSRTHVNPLKWLSMAFLGFVTLATVAAIHAGDPQAALVAMALFGLAAAPTAAIVLVHGNPFQPPYAVSPAKLIEALDGRG
ncbi:MAG: DUF4239 domain-containing protein [Erythrobacter sp.]|nr:DUF4239 domain-containing protein [Erythrobacter sp.]